MDTNQPPTFSPPNIPAPPPPGVFGTKIPSAVAFAVGILLFLLPFAEVKCNGNAFASNTGLGIATGKEWKSAGGMFGNELNETTKADNNQKKDPNMYAIVALALGVIGLALSFTNARAAIGGALISGGLSAAALIGLMIDLKKEARNPIPGKTGTDIDKTMNLDNTINSIKVTIEFTPWFYIAVAAFLVAAFFCYKRMQTIR